MTVPRLSNLVGGEWRSTGDWLEVRDPADRRHVVAEVPAMGADDVAEVYEAAREGAALWRRTSPVARGRILLGAAALLRRDIDEIARTLTREMGKTLCEARAETNKAAEFFEYCAALGRAPQGELLADERAGAHAWTVREPVGVVLAICPWNDPLLTPARKLGPALITGNAVILKPATYTPAVSLHLARVFADAGLPPGVLGTVTGPAARIADALLADETLAAVSFTGSTEVGRTLRGALAARNVKLLAELGGKNAAVVLGDADLDLAAQTIAPAAFAQAGQRCTATSRVIVDRSVLEPMVERLTARAEAVVVGPGLDERTTMGPLVSLEQRTLVAGFVERALADGARGELTELDDERLSNGCFHPPVVVYDVDPASEIWQEEVFGPVVAVVAVDDLDHALEVLNDSRYGLAAGVFTSDLRSAHRFCDEADVGQVAVNLPTSGWDVHMPFGGFKESGSGAKEQGVEGLSFYTRTKTVALAA